MADTMPVFQDTSGDESCAQDSYRLLLQGKLEGSSPRPAVNEKLSKDPSIDEDETCTCWQWLLERVDTPGFRTFIGSVTILNLLCNGAEIQGESKYWPFVLSLFLLIYITEMVLKYAKYGCSLTPTPRQDEVARDQATFLPSSEAALNFFDLALIVAGILELLLPLIGFGRYALYFKFLRLLRALRIFRQFDVLSRFVECLVGLAPNLTWIFGVILLSGYVFAAAITIYVNASEDGDLEEAKPYFATVNVAMFSLFQVTTMDGWAEIAGPLIRYNPCWMVFFVSFIAFSSWTMISLLTAVVSDNMIAATQMRKEDEKAMEEKRRLEFINFLRVTFAEADDDGNGMLDEDEFNNMINDDKVVLKMEELGVKLPREDLRRTFKMLDVDQSGELSIEEFIEGLTQLQQRLNTAHVVSLDYALKRVQFTLLERMAVLQAMLSTNHQNLEHLVKAMTKLTKSVDELRGDLKVHRESRSMLQSSSRSFTWSASKTFF